MSLKPTSPDTEKKSLGVGLQREGRLELRLDAVSEEPGTGYLKVQAHVTKTGVFEYERGDEVLKELRSEREVFDQASMDSLVGVDLTIYHPSQVSDHSMVSPSNWKELSVGSVISADAEPPYVKSTLLIKDPEAIRMVRQKRLPEISCGYKMGLRRCDSTTADLEQYGIRYNHAALVPEGHARLGRDMRLRLDSKYHQLEATMPEDNTVHEAVDALKSGVEANSTAIQEIKTLVTKLVDTQDALEKKMAEDTKPPVQKFEDLPEKEKVEQLIQEQVASMLHIELQARDAYEEVFGWKQDSRGEWVRNDLYHVEPVLCARKLCQDVLQTVDSDRIIQDDEDLTPYVREVQLRAKLARQHRIDSRPSYGNLSAALRGTPASAFQGTKASAFNHTNSKSAIDAHIFGTDEG